MNDLTENINYPYLIRRYSSFLIDQLFVIFIIIAISSFLQNIGFFPTSIKIGLIALFFLYEPILVSTSFTFGQFLTKIRVRDVNDLNKKINFPKALIRFVTKIFLGIISFFTINSNEQKRAIHDMVGQSVMIDLK